MRTRNALDPSVPDEIAATVIASIAKIKAIDRERIGLDSTYEELKMDSLDGLDLLFELEEAFNLAIPDDRTRSLRTVRDVVVEIEKLLSERDHKPPAQN